ncbi:MAG: VanW family protein [Candidatus Shapirobacteria bacterium]
MKVKILIFIIIAIFLSSAVLLFPLIKNYGKTAKNTFLLGNDYSTLSREQIVQKLSADFPFPSSLKLTTADQNYDLKLASISAEINLSKTAGNLLYRRLTEGVLVYIKNFFAPKNFILQINYNDEQLNQYLTDLSAQVNRPFVPSELELEETNVTLKSGQIGQEIDIAVLKADILTALQYANFSSPIAIQTHPVGSLPDDSQVTAALARGQKLISKSLTLNYDVTNLVLDDKTLVGWLDFNNSFNLADLGDYVKVVSQSLNRSPVDAILKFENNKVSDFRPATNGVVVKEADLTGLLNSTLENLITSDQKNLSVTVPVDTVKPAVATNDVNNFGIRELLGRGSSTFKHSNTIRNFNIEKGASVINRILVAPGETFSFIKNLGEVTIESGFKKAYIIRAGKTELDIGGGICQVSTTLFRAMLNSGLDITERQNHAYRVGYYEEDMPPGYDATVFIPSPDLKFVNDTGHHVLIQNIYDGKNKKLTYEIYGTSDGRQVDISNYRRWDATPAPPDVYIDDPTLPPGKVVQDEHRIAGLKTAFDWKVTRDGQILHQKTFQSNFVPWAAVYRRGLPQP